MKKPRENRSSSTDNIDIPDQGIEEKIEREIGSLVQRGQKKQIINRVQKIIAEEHFSGPLPHPKHLIDYDTILPGAAERILTMAEKAQSHSAEMDRLIVQAQIDDQKRGMNYGLAALLLILALAFIFGYWDRPITAGLFLTAAVIGSIPVFVNGRKKVN
jgi:uncharacterized membrane protein